MKASAATPPTASAPAPTPRLPSGQGERGAAARGTAPKELTFRAVLAERGGLVETRAVSGDAAVPGSCLAPLRERGGRSDDPAEREPPQPREAPRLPPPEALREPGPASFGAPAVGQAAPAPSIGGPAVEPAVLAAVAERVLRSLRVGTDAQGRSLVLLDVAEGPLAGCVVQLRRVAGGVAVEVRDHAGGSDAREEVVVEALRRRGIEVV